MIPNGKTLFICWVTALLSTAWLALFAAASEPRGFSATSTASGSQIYTVAQIRSAVLNKIETELSGPFQLEVDVLYPREPFTVPSGTIHAKVTAVGSQRRLGRRPFHLVLQLGGKVILRTRVLADVTALAQVVVPVRPILPDETIGSEDVVMKDIRLSTMRHPYAAEPEQAIGKRVIRTLRPHTPIQLSALSAPHLIGKGERVTIEARRGGLLIQTAGITRTAGQLGQVLVVTNLDSKRDVQARVIGPGLVEVEF